MDDFIYFFDSYALIEILEGSPDYARFVNCSVVTSKMNLFEVYSHFLRENNFDQARKFLFEYYPVAQDFDMETIEEAARFRVENKSRRMSMVDCIGYVIARRRGILFLTGDKEFEHFNNVEFVK